MLLFIRDLFQLNVLIAMLKCATHIYIHPKQEKETAPVIGPILCMMDVWLNRLEGCA